MKNKSDIQRLEIHGLSESKFQFLNEKLKDNQ